MRKTIRSISVGIEKIRWARLNSVDLVEERYSKGQDIAFYEGTPLFDFTLTKGTFLLLYPDDAHLPGLSAEKDVHVRKNYSFLAGLFHYIEVMLDQYNITTGIGIASKYCTTLEINSDQGREQMPFVKKRKLLVWNVKEHIDQLPEEKREMILKIYMESYIKEFDYEQQYNLLLTNPLYIDGDVACEEEQIKVYQKIIKKYHLDDKCKLLIKPHPRDCTDYTKKIDGILIDGMISAEILCISRKLKLNRVVALYSSSADAFINQANEVIRIADNEEKGIIFCRKMLNKKG